MGEPCVLAIEGWLSRHRSQGPRWVRNWGVVWSLKEQSQTLGSLNRLYSLGCSFCLGYPDISLHTPLECNSTPEGNPLVGMEKHWETIIKQIWRFTLRLWSGLSGDPIGDGKRVKSEIHSKAIIAQVCRCYWKLTLSEHTVGSGGHEWARVENHMETELEWS
jgi:hypothetical protein